MVYVIDNRNVRRKHLWKYGLHLVKSGKVILTNNSLPYLNNFFNTHALSGSIYLGDDIRNIKPGISVSKSSAADPKTL